MSMEFYPGPGERILNMSYAVPFVGNITDYMAKVSYSGDGQIEFDALPDWPGTKLGDDPFLVRQFPSIGYCSTAGGLGEPTVNIPVSQLTTDTTTIITMAGTPKPARPTTTADGHPQPVSTMATADPSNNSLGPNLRPHSSAADHKPTFQHTSAGDNTGSIGQSPSPGHAKPLSKIISAIQHAASSTVAQETSNQQAPAGSSLSSTRDGVASFIASAIGLKPTLGNTDQKPAPVITVGSSIVTANGQSIYVVGSQTLSPGGSPVVVSDMTYSLVSSGTAVVESGQTKPIESHTGTENGGAPGFSVVTENGASAYAVGTQTWSPGGPPIVISRTTYSLAPSGTALVVNGRTTPIGVAIAPGHVVTIGPSVVTANSASAYIFGSQTLAPGGAPVVVKGTTYSLASGETDLVVNGYRTPVGQVTGRVIKIANSMVTENSASAYVFGTQTISPGGQPIVVSGTTYSLVPSGTAFVVNGRTTPIGEATANGITGGPEPTGVVTINGQAFSYTEVGQNKLVIGSQTIDVGGPPVIAAGEIVSLAFSDMIEINGSPVTTLPRPGVTATPSTEILTIGSQTVPYEFSRSNILVGSQTLAPGSTLVVDGETLTLGPQKSEIEAISGSSTMTLVGGSATASATIHLQSENDAMRVRNDAWMLSLISVFTVLALGLVYTM